MQTNSYNFFILLDWIYQQFLLIYIICLLGCFIRDMIDTMKNGTKINIRQIIISSFICSIILCVLLDKSIICPKMSINVFVCICFFAGLWSSNIVDYVINWKYVKTFLKHILKCIKGNISKALNETIDELEDEKDKDEKD